MLSACPSSGWRSLRDEATEPGEKLQSVALNSALSLPVPTRLAGKPRRRRSDCRPSAVRLPGRVADARDRVAGTPSDRGEIRDETECESAEYGAAKA